ncbi:MAG TPA: carbohydrate ABC transporter permease [Caldilineaceae bacterium]|nr:carbohydrate ABC transporter permease [Caldilineaceae bacterium]
MTRKQRSWLGVAFLYLCGLALMLYILGPFLWVLSASFQMETELFKQPPNWIPARPTLGNYLYVFTGEIPQAYTERGLLRSPITQEARLLPAGLVNSLVIALGVTAANLLLGALAAYTFARERFRGRDQVYLFILGSRLLPPIAVAIPIYMIVNELNLLDTKRALLLLHGAFTLPFTIWVLTTYFQNLPRDIEEAALVDGCTRFAALRHIVLPVAAPGLVAVGAFAFLFSYSEFPFALFTTQTINAKTIPVLISAVANNPDASYTLIAVGVMISILPPLLLALLLRNVLTTGLSSLLGR